MAISKVVYGGDTLIDLTEDTVVANKLLSGYTAHGADGEAITGAYEETPFKSGIYQDENGYICVSPYDRAGGCEYDGGYIVLDDKMGVSLDDGLYLDADNTLNVSQYACDIDDVIIRDSTLILPPVIFPKHEVYTITENLTYTTSSNAIDVIEEDSGLIIDLNADFAHLSGRITSVTVTMGGVDITDQVFSGPLDTKSITANGTYSAASEYLSGYSEVTVAVEGGSVLQTKTATPTTSQQTISPDTGYDGLSSVTVEAIPNTYIIPTGTKSITENGTGIDVTSYAAVDVSVSGGSAPVLQTKSVSPTESAQTVTPDTGYDGLSEVSVGAISSSYIGSGVTQRSSSDLIASGATVTAPAGYYSSNATKSVASGTEGTPTATKGTVSNHSVSVTPSVTNTAGYISGGTHSGTAVTVSASELDSGTKTISDNGTGIDVVGYAAVDISVPNTFSITDTSNTTGTTAVITAGSGGGGGGGATQHEIHLEFTDNTDATIPVYYDDSLIGTMITAYEPMPWTYGNKTVSTASLDNVEWYDAYSIPLNTQLIDYTEATNGYYIGEDGDTHANEWSAVSDYTPIKYGMTFSYRCYLWYYIGFYDSSKNVINTLYVYNDGTPDPNDSNTGYGTLSGVKIPQNAAYVRLCGGDASSSYMSLIRTA